MVGKLVLKVAGDVPGVVDNRLPSHTVRTMCWPLSTRIVSTSAKRTRRHSAGYTLVGERIADPPRERARPPVVMAEALIDDRLIVLLRVVAARDPRNDRSPAFRALSRLLGRSATCPASPSDDLVGAN